MAKEPDPVFPASLVDRSIRVLVGFGIHKVWSQPVTTGSSFFNVKRFGGVASREALFEFESEIVNGVSIRQVFSASEVKGRVTRIIDHAAHANDSRANVDARRAIGRVPHRLVSIRLFEMADRSPLVLLFDEKTSALVLAIGNIGDHIEWNPQAQGDYKPSWYEQLTVLS